MMKKLLILNLLVFFPISQAQATQPGFPSKNIKMELLFPDSIEIGKEIKVTLFVTPQEEIVHQSDLDDEVCIGISKGVKILAGIPCWNGKLKKGETVQISIIAKIDEPGVYNFFGEAKYCQDSLSRPRPEWKKDFPRGYRYNNRVSRQIKLGIEKIDRVKKGEVIQKGNITAIEEEGLVPFSDTTVKFKIATPTKKPIRTQRLEVQDSTGVIKVVEPSQLMKPPLSDKPVRIEKGTDKIIYPARKPEDKDTTKIIDKPKLKKQPD